MPASCYSRLRLLCVMNVSADDAAMTITRAAAMTMLTDNDDGDFGAPRSTRGNGTRHTRCVCVCGCALSAWRKINIHTYIHTHHADTFSTRPRAPVRCVNNAKRWGVVFFVYDACYAWKCACVGESESERKSARNITAHKKGGKPMSRVVMERTHDRHGLLSSQAAGH